MDFGNVISNLLDQMALFHLGAGSYVMIVVALMFSYLAIKKGFKPLLLIPIALGMLLVNIYSDIMYPPEKTSNGTGGLLWHFFRLDEWSILPPPVFLGAGAMTDLGPLIVNPTSFPAGAAAQLGIYSAYFFAVLLGFLGRGSAAISIIGSADGPTSLLLHGRLGQTQIMGPITVTACSHMTLVPIAQLPLTKFPTTGKERRVEMEQLCPVSKLEKILFPIIVTIVTCLILPSTAPLVGMLVLGNLLRKSSVAKQLTDAASNALIYIVVILLGTSVGATTSVETPLDVTTIGIATLGLTVFIFGTVDDVLLDRSPCKIMGGKINLLTGSAGVFTVPVAARISRKVEAEADSVNFPLIHAMGPDVAGVIGAVIAAGTLVVIFKVQWYDISTATAISPGL